MQRASLKSGALKPHLVRDWLTPAPDEELWPKVTEINAVYHDAPSRAEQGERTVSTDEMTGVQALERKHPGLPLVPGKVERREFEYIRHGTRAFILSRDVVSGQVVAPSVGPTHTEADFLAHLWAPASRGDDYVYAIGRDSARSRHRWHVPRCRPRNGYDSAYRQDADHL